MHDSAKRELPFFFPLWLRIFFSSIFLLGAALPLLIFSHEIQALLIWTETRAIWRIADDIPVGAVNCDGDYARYTFTGPHNKVYDITDGSTCWDGIEDGSQITIWYQPDNPRNLVTDFTANLCRGFLWGFSLPFLLTAAAPWLASLFFFLRGRSSFLGSHTTV